MRHSALRGAGIVVVTLCGAAYGGGCNDLIVPIDGGASATTNGADADFPPGVVVDCGTEDGGFGLPIDLACTGIYPNWPSRTIASAVHTYDPILHLWSDGADKTRWVEIPPGTKIDTTDMNEWVFPVGFKVWKEFKISGHRVETRHFWKRGPNDWARGTYVWNDAETAAQLDPGTGVQNVGGSTYTIPASGDCDECHSGRIDKMLGFEAVGLSQQAPAGQAVDPAALNINSLVSMGVLTNPPPSQAAMQVPDDGSGKVAPALGWLHANCGTACHNPSNASFAGSTGLWMRLEVGPDGLGSFDKTNTYQTAVGRCARFATDAPAATTNAQGQPVWWRIYPGNAAAAGGLSLLPMRDSRRNDPLFQMPPLDTAIPDLTGSGFVIDWVNSMGPPGMGTGCQP